MNDILLTPEKHEELSAEIWDTWYNCAAGLRPWPDYIPDAVRHDYKPLDRWCRSRAQVQKMVDAVQEWAVSADTEATVLKGDIWIPSDDIEWQALKAAGEGK